MTPSERIILALDVPDAAEALHWGARFKGRVGLFKVGLQLFTAEGPGLVTNLAASYGPVFLDLKLHDIPNTVAAAVRSAGKLGVSMLTIHASGGTAMMRAAAEAASGTSRDPGALGAGAGPLRILAVSVLTSLDADDLAAAGVARSPERQVMALAEMAWLAGCDGVVASAREAASVRRALGPDALIVTPGIRGPGDSQGDQARTALPREAIVAGADYLVVGRPVLAAADPEAALDRLLASITG